MSSSWVIVTYHSYLTSQVFHGSVLFFFFLMDHFLQKVEVIGLSELKQLNYALVFNRTSWEWVYGGEIEVFKMFFCEQFIYLEKSSASIDHYCTEEDWERHSFCYKICFQSFWLYNPFLLSMQ